MSQDLFSDSQLFNASQNGSQNDDHFSDGEVNEENEPPFSQMSDNIGENGRNGRLLRTDLTEEQLSKQKRVFVEIAEKTKEAEEVSDICRSTKQLSEQIDRQNKHFRSGGVNENMTLDAKCISANSAISLQLVKKLQTDSKRFDSMEFIEKVLTALNPFQQIEGTDDSDGGQGVDENDWIEFGRKYFKLHTVLPTFNFIHGSFDSTPDQSAPKVPKARTKHPKAVLSAQTGATQIDPNTKIADDSTPEEVELILKTIKKLEQKNSSLPYIEVMVNPKSMAETVENVFHSAFLVKEGQTRLAADAEGGPTIESIDNSDIDSSQTTDGGIQSVFSFSTRDWKKWIEEFEITKAAIRHPKK